MLKLFHRSASNQQLTVRESPSLFLFFIFVTSYVTFSPSQLQLCLHCYLFMFVIKKCIITLHYHESICS